MAHQLPFEGKLRHKDGLPEGWIVKEFLNSHLRHFVIEVHGVAVAWGNREGEKHPNPEIADWVVRGYNVAETAPKIDAALVEFRRKYRVKVERKAAREAIKAAFDRAAYERKIIQAVNGEKP